MKLRTKTGLLRVNWSETENDKTFHSYAKNGMNNDGKIKLRTEFGTWSISESSPLPELTLDMFSISETKTLDYLYSSSIDRELQNRHINLYIRE